MTLAEGLRRNTKFSHSFAPIMDYQFCPYCGQGCLLLFGTWFPICPYSGQTFCFRHSSMHLFVTRLFAPIWDMVPDLRLNWTNFLFATSKFASICDKVVCPYLEQDLNFAPIVDKAVCSYLRQGSLFAPILAKVCCLCLQHNTKFAPICDKVVCPFLGQDINFAPVVDKAVCSYLGHGSRFAPILD